MNVLYAKKYRKQTKRVADATNPLKKKIGQKFICNIKLLTLSSFVRYNVKKIITFAYDLFLLAGMQYSALVNSLTSF
jgi:hypothetical protein